MIDMNKIIANILMWSEVWALLIPLAIIIFQRGKRPGMRPIIIYVIVGLFLNLSATMISVYRLQLPVWLQNNNILYNLHSMARVFLFSWFIINLNLIRGS